MVEVISFKRLTWRMSLRVGKGCVYVETAINDKSGDTSEAEKRFIILYADVYAEATR